LRTYGKNNISKAFLSGSEAFARGAWESYLTVGRAAIDRVFLKKVLAENKKVFKKAKAIVK